MIYFPITLETPKKKVKPKIAKKGKDLHSKRILLVEDDRTVNKLLKMLLEEEGYLVNQSESPVKALEMIRNIHVGFDLVISDIVMPKMSGLDMVKEISEELPEMKILFITGYVDSPNIKIITELGYDIILKPFTPDVLFDKINSLFD